jgi:hypothetical protein
LLGKSMASLMELDLSLIFVERRVKNEHWSIKSAKDILLKTLESFTKVRIWNG